MDTLLLWAIILLLLVGTGVGVNRGPNAKQLEYRLSRLERKLDLTLEHLGVEEPPSDLAVELDALLRAGKRVDAIKRYRLVTGAGLKEAKDEVDRMGGA